MAGADSDEPWGDNTTCVTGNTSEHSYSPCEEIRGLRKPDPSADGKSSSVHLRCGRHVWRLLASTVALTALLSPLAMIILPKTIPLLADAVHNDTKVANGRRQPLMHDWKTSVRL